MAQCVVASLLLPSEIKVVMQWMQNTTDFKLFQKINTTSEMLIVKGGTL